MTSAVRAVVLAAALTIPGAAFAAPLTCTDPSAGMGSDGNAPAGCIWDLYQTTGSTGSFVLSSYTFFSTSFVASASSEYVSFAFRETPAYFAFDDSCVSSSAITSSSCPGNLLSSPGFEAAGTVYGQNCNHNNALGCPPGWGAWIQSLDISAIGQIATSSSTYGCNVGAHGGSNFWCDGSVQGYDAVYQQLTGLTVGTTYNIGFWLEDDSGSPITPANTDTTTSDAGQIDALVYAGTSLPVGAIPLNTPEPFTFGLAGLGLAGVAMVRIRQRRKRQS
jgi:PEP-CTERM motif